MICINMMYLIINTIYLTMAFGSRLANTFDGF